MIGPAAALIANHGLVAVAPKPDEALHGTADEVNKNFASVYTYLRQHPL